MRSVGKGSNALLRSQRMRSASSFPKIQQCCCRISLALWFHRIGIAGTVFRQSLYYRNMSLNIWVTDIVVISIPVILSVIPALLVLSSFVTLMIVVLIIWVGLTSHIVCNFLAAYTLEVNRFATVVAESFLTDGFIRLNVFQIRRTSKEIIAVRIL